MFKLVGVSGITSRGRAILKKVSPYHKELTLEEFFNKSWATKSRLTIEKHVERIMSKLGCTTRVQIATWVVEKGLLKPSL